MTEAAFGPAARRPRERHDVPVPGYPLDPVDAADGRARRPSGFWRVVAAIVQALLCILVVLVALATVVG
jgi:hypothetical protein